MKNIYKFLIEYEKGVHLIPYFYLHRRKLILDTYNKYLYFYLLKTSKFLLKDDQYFNSKTRRSTVNAKLKGIKKKNDLKETKSIKMY